MEEEQKFDEKQFEIDYNSEPHQRTNYHALWWREDETDYIELEYEQIDITGLYNEQNCYLRFRGERYDEELDKRSEFENKFEIAFNGKKEVIKFLEKALKELKEYETPVEEHRRKYSKRKLKFLKRK